MKAAVIYARYSSEAQNEQSIEGQLRVCHSYAESHDLLVIEEYIDRAMTGTNDARPAFQKMLRDSAEHKWEAVLVYKLDRFSRNKYESVVHKKTLRDNGVAVVSATEAIPDTPEGIILESLLEGMNQYYSMELAQKVRRGMRECYIKGNFTGGYVQYGYRVENKKLYIVPDEAKVVQEIFFKYAQGYTVSEIVKALKSRGVVGRKGEPLTAKKVYVLLNFSKYRGLVEHDGVIYDNIYPRIISDEIWDKVQMRHKENELGVGVKTSSNYLLSGKVYCGTCHHSLIGFCAYGRFKRKYFYYACNRARTFHNDCPAKPIYRDDLHNTVFNTTSKLFADENTILQIARLVMREHEKAIANDNTLQSLTSRLETTRRAISNLLKVIEEGIITDQTKLRIKELQEKERQLQMDINLEKVRLRPDLNITEVIDFLQSQFYGDTQDDEIRKVLLNTFIYAVIREETTVTIIYNYRDNLIPSRLSREEVQTLLATAKEKGVVFNGTTFFFTPNRFGVTVRLPKHD